MRILWHSVPPMIPTGYGSQTKLMARALRRLGHDVAISATISTPGATLNWEGIPIFPDSGNPGKYGMDMVAQHQKKWGADVVISWLDAHGITEDAWGKTKNWLAWVPVDSSPLMSQNVKPLQHVKWQVAPTRWGVEELVAAGFPDALFLPCAHDPATFYPMADRDAARASLGKTLRQDLTGKYLVNVVSNNSGGRKNFQAIFAAWKMFLRDNPDGLLYLHTDITGYFNGGNDLIEMAKLYGVADNSVCFAAQWEYNTGQIGEDFLNLLYNASDLHLNCCYGEGFGLPIMDAQAAGCPTVVPAFAAAGEIGKGTLVTDGVRYSTVPGAHQFMVDARAVARAMAEERGRAGEARREAMHQASRPWQIDEVVENHLKPLLLRLESGRVR